MKKFFAIFAIAILALVGCEQKPDNNGGSKAGKIDGEWHIVEWNGESPEFEVYVKFESGSFEIYQQVWSFDYELYTGTYTINGDIVTGVYADGSNWACGYKVNVVDGQLTMYSQEDQSVTSLYEKCTIPEEIKAEASTTRAMEVVPFL